jgi:dipeptidyl-peptidase-3
MFFSIAQSNSQTDTASNRIYSIERVGPARIVQVYADGFDQLSLKQKTFTYYLYLAAIAGRDISLDQHHPDMLAVRDLFEGVYTHPDGIDATVMQEITSYLKLFWVNNGFYDNYNSGKFVPTCTFEEFRSACLTAQKNGADLGLAGELLDTRLNRLKGIIFDPNYQPMLTDKTPGVDWIKGSAVNFYGQNLSLDEVDAWSKSGKEKNALNSKVVKDNGEIVEKVWRAGGDGVAPGMYASDLSAVNKWLGKAIPFAASDYQAQTVQLLINYFKTGDLEDFRKFNIHWVKDSSAVDFILGFIEVYLDPRGQKAEFESSIYYTDPEQTKLMQNLASCAQYFEDKAPWKDEYKKHIEHSPIANVINVVVETGGDGPVSPIGINLPNEQAIRQQYGAKSVLLHNVVVAADKSSGRDLVEEFAYDKEEIANQDTFGSFADNLQTAMHEVIGHGSGKVSDKLGGKDPADFLPGYYSTLEEARADLVALWNAWDPKLVDLGIVKNATDLQKIAQTMYQQAIRVAITQLRRIGDSDQLEEDHMKDRQLIANYIMQDTGAVKVVKRDGKTYYHIVDYEKAHQAVGKLLAELMRIKAEGDLPAVKQLIDKFGLKVDPKLRDEVQERIKKLDVASYSGYVQPKLEPVMDANGNITDVKVTYPLDLAKQMLEYSAFTKKQRAEFTK